METEDFLTRSKVLIVAGKGGVGKTVAVGALARAASRRGLAVAVVEVDGKTGLAATFGLDGPLEYDERLLIEPGEWCGRPTGAVTGRTVTPDEALVDYLDGHGFGRVTSRLVGMGAIELATRAAPGLKDVILLGKVKQLSARPDLDLVILDAPAAGHALTILTSPKGVVDAVPSGPIAAQADAVLAMLGDPERCRVSLVTLAEETPVNETVETAFAVEDLIGVELAPIVVNGVLPDRPALHGAAGAALEAARSTGSTIELSDSDLAALDAAARHLRARRTGQIAQIRRLAEALPLPQLHLPRLMGVEMDLAAMDRLADAVDRAVADLDESVLA